MAKFHLNDKGDPGLCRAVSGKCPFGGDDKHFTSAEAARTAFENNQESLLATVKKENTATAPVVAQVTWNDFNGALSNARNAEEITEAIERELAQLVTEGEYPEGTVLVKYLGGGLADDREPAEIIVGTSNRSSMLAFYTSYCGGDEEQARAELSEFEGLDFSDIEPSLGED